MDNIEASILRLLDPLLESAMRKDENRVEVEHKHASDIRGALNPVSGPVGVLSGGFCDVQFALVIANGHSGVTSGRALLCGRVSRVRDAPTPTDRQIQQTRRYLPWPMQASGRGRPGE